MTAESALEGANRAAVAKAQRLMELEQYAEAIVGFSEALDAEPPPQVRREPHTLLAYSSPTPHLLLASSAPYPRLLLAYSSPTPHPILTPSSSPLPHLVLTLSYSSPIPILSSPTPHLIVTTSSPNPHAIILTHGLLRTHRLPMQRVSWS